MLKARPAVLAGGLAVVVNSAGASISLLDMDLRKEIKRIPVLREPHHLTLTPDGKTLLIQAPRLSPGYRPRGSANPSRTPHQSFNRNHPH